MFHRLHESTNIVTQEDFEDSEFYESELLMGVSHVNCLFGLSDLDEGVEELYYFLLDNSSIVQKDGDFLLCKFDEKKFVIGDLEERFVIIINRGDEEDFLEMLN